MSRDGDMAQGSVEAIYVASAPGAPMRSVAEVRARPGAGLEGDRYAAGAGTFSRETGSDRQVTLIEREALEAGRRDYRLEIPPEGTRRNLLTRGVYLNHLVGREFRVGEVRLRGVELCEPCDTLEKNTCPGARRALIHRGGLRAEILAGGTLRPGDPIHAS